MKYMCFVRFIAFDMPVCFQTIQDLRFLPFSADAVEQKVHEFRNYSDEIRRCLPDILLATMTILLSQYRNTKYVFRTHPYIKCALMGGSYLILGSFTYVQVCIATERDLLVK